MLDTCCILEDLIVVAALTEYPKKKEIRNTLDYLMNKSNITPDELTEYRVSKK